jgi:hypothetical protein
LQLLDVRRDVGERNRAWRSLRPGGPGAAGTPCGPVAPTGPCGLRGRAGHHLRAALAARPLLVPWLRPSRQDRGHPVRPPGLVVRQVLGDHADPPPPGPRRLPIGSGSPPRMSRAGRSDRHGPRSSHRSGHTPSAFSPAVRRRSPAAPKARTQAIAKPKDGGDAPRRSMRPRFHGASLADSPRGRSASQEGSDPRLREAPRRTEESGGGIATYGVCGLSGGLPSP